MSDLPEGWTLEDVEGAEWQVYGPNGYRLFVRKDAFTREEMETTIGVLAKDSYRYHERLQDQFYEKNDECCMWYQRARAAGWDKPAMRWAKLQEIAEQRGFVQWWKSGAIERLRMEGSHGTFPRLMAQDIHTGNVHEIRQPPVSGHEFYCTELPPTTRLPLGALYRALS